MQPYITKKILNGFVLGLGIVLALGIFFVARAIAPGVTTNPTFSPTGDDIQLKNYYLKGPVQIVETSGTGSVLCPAGYKVTGGGCYSSGGVISYFVQNNAFANLSGWTCSGTAASGILIAQAICVQSP